VKGFNVKHSFMNILLINHYAGSPELGMEYRPFYLSREWARKGHNVTILAASFAHIRRNQPKVSKDFTEEIISSIKYVWIKTPKYKGNGLGRIMNMFVFVYKLWFCATRISKKYKPQVVIASSTYPLDNYPAHRIARKSKAKYVYEVHDLWPLSPMELGGYSKNHPFIRIMQAAENFAYKNVDILISMLPKTLSHMQEHGLKPSKWHYIPNGIDPEEWVADQLIPEVHLKVLNEIKQQGSKLIGYTGSIGIANALDNLVNAATIIRNENIRFVIIGDGPEKEKLMTEVKRSNLDNVVFLEPVLKKCIPSILNYFDILFIGWQRQPLYRFGISPNKLLDYMMAAKPIIHAFEAGNDMVNESGCGISIEPENSEALTKAINTILAYPAEEVMKMGENGRRYVLKNHNYLALAEEMIWIFSKKNDSSN
jgi:glycosyltransferase involved in cell wall biosynthesis